MSEPEIGPIDLGETMVVDRAGYKRLVADAMRAERVLALLDAAPDADLLKRYTTGVIDPLTHEEGLLFDWLETVAIFKRGPSR